MTNVVPSTKRTPKIANLLKEIAKTKIAQSRSLPSQTQSAKKASWKGALSAEKRTQLKSLLTLAANIFATTVLTEPKILNPGEAENLLTEYVTLQDVGLATKARMEAIKPYVVESVRLSYEKDGVEDAAVLPGSIPVPVLGKKFSLEGGGRTEVDFDLVMLRELLGDDVWSDVVDVVEVPEVRIAAYDLEVVNEDRLLAHIQTNPAAFDHVRAALIPGQPKPFKLNIREIKDDE